MKNVYINMDPENPPCNDWHESSFENSFDWCLLQSKPKRFAGNMWLLHLTC